MVLLPAALRDASPEQRTAVLCHELLHVRRRDWPWVLVEEAVLALLWFHPAVWWLVGELQLAREQVVDRLTVDATGARRAYMDALFSAADAPSAPPLLAGFLRRRHLARRLIALTEEVVMSRVRLAVGGVLALGVLLGSGAAAVAAWPLAAAQASTVPGGAAAPGQLAVAHRETIDVPGGLSQELTSATILLDLVVDAQGEVTSVRPVSFAMRNTPTGMSVSVTDAKTVVAMLREIATKGDASRRPAVDAPAIARDLDLMLRAATSALMQWRFAPPAAAPAIARVDARFDLATGQVTTGAPQAISGFSGAPGPLSTFVTRPDSLSTDDGALRVGGMIRPPQKIVNVNAVYPQEAQDAKVQGVVVIEAKIGADGHVAEAWVLRSIPMLDQAALDAVRQWRYAPTLLNGAPRSRHLHDHRQLHARALASRSAQPPACGRGRSKHCYDDLGGRHVGSSLPRLRHSCLCVPERRGGGVAAPRTVRLATGAGRRHAAHPAEDRPERCPSRYRRTSTRGWGACSCSSRRTSPRTGQSPTSA